LAGHTHVVQRSRTHPGAPGHDACSPDQRAV
jgi:hypothetical protein